MTSTPTQTYSTESDTKYRINKNLANDNDSEKIQIHRNYADNFINSQIIVHTSLSTVDGDTELQYLSSSLAAAEYNFWTSKENPKDDLIDECMEIEQAIEDYIKAKYAKKSSGGLSGEDTFGTTSSITGDY